MKKRILVSLPATLLVLFGTGITFATADTEFSQIINTGNLSVDIMNASEQPVVNPSVPLATIATAATCNTTDSTGTLGTNSERIYIDNPGAADDGWSLAIAATNGPTAQWTSGSDEYDFNDPTDNGCDDGADADSISGQMTIDPSGAALTASCHNGCTNTGASMGSSEAFVQGTTNAIGLAVAGSSSDNVWRGYMTGVDVTQTIPAGQVPGNYTLDMTITATAS